MGQIGAMIDDLHMKHKQQKGFPMNRTIRTSLLCLAMVILAACGRQSVDDELLPTAIATLDASSLGAAAEQAATVTLEAPTPTPTLPVAEAAATATEQPDESPLATPATLTATQATTLTGFVTANAPITIEAALTETRAATLQAAGDSLTTTGKMSATTAVSDPAIITNETGLSATVDITTPIQVATTAPVSEAESLLPVTAIATQAGTENTPGMDDKDQDADPYIGLPANIGTALAQADPMHGQQLTLQNGCIGCHNLDPNVMMVGPTWHNIASTAETRVEGQTAAHYIYNSIVAPNDYLVEGYPPGLMVQTFAQTISEQDLADIIGYLLTLREQ
jgi:hypothetical protein